MIRTFKSTKEYHDFAGRTEHGVYLDEIWIYPLESGSGYAVESTYLSMPNGDSTESRRKLRVDSFEDPRDAEVYAATLDVIGRTGLRGMVRTIYLSHEAYDHVRAWIEEGERALLELVESAAFNATAGFTAHGVSGALEGLRSASAMLRLALSGQQWAVESSPIARVISRAKNNMERCSNQAADDRIRNSAESAKLAAANPPKDSETNQAEVEKRGAEQSKE